MKYLRVERIIEIHRYQIERFGGTPGVRSPELLDSAVARPLASFGGRELYPTLIEKAAALGHSLIQNHPFHDGNKRTGAGALTMFLGRNGFTIRAGQDEQADIFERVAGKEPRMTYEDLLGWLQIQIGRR